MPGAAATTGYRGAATVSAIHDDAHRRDGVRSQAGWRQSVDLRGAGVEDRRCCAAEQQLRVRFIESGAEDRDDFTGRDGASRKAGRIDQLPGRQFPRQPTDGVKLRMRLLPESAIRMVPFAPIAMPAGAFNWADRAGLPSPENPSVPVPAIAVSTPDALSWRMTLAPVSAMISVPSDANAMPPGELRPAIQEVGVPSDATFQIWLASATTTLPDASTATASGAVDFCESARRSGSRHLDDAVVAGIRDVNRSLGIHRN